MEENTGTTSQESPVHKEGRIVKKESSETTEPRGVKRERSSHSPSSKDDNPPKPSIAPPPGSLPPPLLTLLQSIQSTLRTAFSTAPPHTAQRLAELLLHPTVHYRTLPSYLRALDRVVSVASPASIFPLPTLIPAASTNGPTLNGTSSPSPELADKDFIGGAELTEIPWLRNPTSPSPIHNGPTSDLRTESTSLIDGPNGAGSIETVSVSVNGVSSAAAPRDDTTSPLQQPQHGITQGELLRQEQEAGIVPVPTPAHTSRVTRSSTAATAAAWRAVGTGTGTEDGEVLPDAPAEPEEPVHVRGPNVIGMEDMGPQSPGSGLEGGLDVEGALGRRGEGEGLAHAVGRDGEGERVNGEKEEGKEDDTVAADADGEIDGEGAGCE